MMPFPGGMESTANATLVFSLGAAIFYLNMLERAPDLRRSAAKTLSVAFLALLTVMERGPLLLAAALVLSAIGDAFLSRHGDRAFLAGLGSFLLAHIAYALLFALAGDGFGILFAEPMRVVIGLAMLAGTATLILRLRAAVPLEMKAAVTLYALAILSMGFAALTVPGPWIVLGAVAFMASDALLGVEKFMMSGDTEPRKVMRHAVWVLYYAAQATITLGVLLVPRD